MELIHNWQRRDLTCWFCCSKKSVKYKIPVLIVDTLPIDKQTNKVYACNKCALLFSTPEVN